MVLHVSRCYILWLTEFGQGGRFFRSHQKCPSNKRLPPVGQKKKKKELRRLSSFDTKVADTLDMDHIHLPFHYFLWGMTFIWPLVVFQGVRGLITLRLRSGLQHWIKPKPFDPAKVCHDFCLYGAMAIYFIGFNENGTARFFFGDLPIINKDGLIRIKKLRVDIDLKTKRLHSAALDEKSNLSAKEVLILLSFYVAFANHVKIHAVANWAVQVEKSGEKTSFLSRNSIATVMYNYFGYRGFVDQFSTFQAMGLLSPDLQSKVVTESFDHAIMSGVHEHSSVTKLFKYSSFVRFIVKTRTIFIREFNKHHDFFPNCSNVEACKLHNTF